MKYLKSFNSQSEYESYTGSTEYITPNVSLIDEDDHIEYKPYEPPPVPPTPTHDYVEIGGIKWATMNIGASSVTDAGLYFQWGDTQGYTADQVGSGSGQKYFNFADYKYGNGTAFPGDTGITKYNSTDGKTVLEASDDAANAAWGGNWRMPTDEEYHSLFSSTNTAWTNDYQGSGVSGLVCTDKTDNTKQLFLPVAGACSNGTIYNTTSYGHYWSNLLKSEFISQAYCLLIYNQYPPSWSYYSGRAVGLLVRAILDE